MAISTYQSTRLQRNELMRQSIENGVVQGMEAHSRQENVWKKFCTYVI